MTLSFCDSLNNEGISKKGIHLCDFLGKGYSSAYSYGKLRTEGCSFRIVKKCMSNLVDNRK